MSKADGQIRSRKSIQRNLVIRQLGVIAESVPKRTLRQKKQTARAPRGSLTNTKGVEYQANIEAGASSLGSTPSIARSSDSLA
jgi:hypothetical protein